MTAVRHQPPTVTDAELNHARRWGIEPTSAVNTTTSSIVGLAWSAPPLIGTLAGFSSHADGCGAWALPNLMCSLSVDPWSSEQRRRESMQGHRRPWQRRRRGVGAPRQEKDEDKLDKHLSAMANNLRLHLLWRSTPRSSRSSPPPPSPYSLGSRSWGGGAGRVVGPL
jgi:hypothetical protein